MMVDTIIIRFARLAVVQLGVSSHVLRWCCWSLKAGAVSTWAKLQQACVTFGRSFSLSCLVLFLQCLFDFTICSISTSDSRRNEHNIPNFKCGMSSTPNLLLQIANIGLCRQNEHNQPQNLRPTYQRIEEASQQTLPLFRGLL